MTLALTGDLSSTTARGVTPAPQIVVVIVLVTTKGLPVSVIVAGAPSSKTGTAEMVEVTTGAVIVIVDSP